MSKSKAKSFQGKDVFVGIDVHKKTYAIAAVCKGVKVKQFTSEASPEVLVRSLRHAFAGANIHAAYEAGFSGFKLHRHLSKSGARSQVVNPASIYVRANNAVKTDKRDALAIATQLEAKLLEPVFAPNEEQELDRIAARDRERTVKDRTKVANQIKSKLYNFSIPFEDKPLCKKRLQTLKELVLPEALRRSLDRLIRRYEYLTQEIKDIQEELKEQASKDDYETILRSVPGIGAVTSRVISTEMITIDRFKNGRKLAAFFGLTPKEHSSGERIRRGSITKQGSGLLRRCLVEASWVAIRKDKTLREKYERLKVRAGGNKAIVAVARTLLIRVGACLRKGVPYQVAS